MGLPRRGAERLWRLDILLLLQPSAQRLPCPGRWAWVPEALPRMMPPDRGVGVPATRPQPLHFTSLGARMSRLSRSISILACCAALDSSVAATPDGKFVVFSLGNNTCSTVIDEVARYADGEQVYMAYIEGFLTAVNFQAAGEANFFAGTDQRARYRFVLRYCEDHPVDIVLVGVVAVVHKFKPGWPAPSP
jgi:hypothetical protein